MAEVHLARMRGPMNFEKLVVVKTIHPELASQDEFLRMLFDEARLSALIRHPSVVDIYELGRAGDAYFIAMEYLDGQALSTVVAAGSKGYAIDPCSGARIIADAAAGLHAAHELRTSSGKLYELVHRDISPGNIMVLYDGNVKIVDFGVAKARGRLTTSAGHQLKGKLGYASPEQLAAQKVDRRSDIFSLGVVLWEVLANCRLFPGDELQSAIDRASGKDIPPPSAHCPQVPPPLDDVVKRALASRPEDRFQTAAEMKQALEDVLRSLGSHRENDSIAHYMTGTFARRRDERAQLLHRRRSPTESEFELADNAGRFDAEEAAPPPALSKDSDAHIVVRTGEPSGSIASRHASWPRRHRWAIAAAALVMLGIGGTAVLGEWTGGDGERRPSAARASAPTSSPLPAAASVPSAHADPGTPAPASAPAPAPAAPIADTPGRTSVPTPAGKPTRSADELEREGAALFVQGKPADAKHRFKAAIALDPRRASAYRGLGLAYQALGKREQAIAAFEKYLRLSPGAPDAAAIRARLEKLAP